MPQKFVIGALPRSGTAWAAMLLNLHTGVYCFHDLVATAQARTYSEALNKTGLRAVGDCSSAAVAPAFDDLKAKRLFLSRDPEECKKSLIAVMGDAAIPAFEAAIKACDDWVAKFEPDIISFEKLFTGPEKDRKAEAARLVELATGIGLSHHAWNFAKGLNVQIEGLDPQFYEKKKLITKL